MGEGAAGCYIDELSRKKYEVNLDSLLTKRQLIHLVTLFYQKRLLLLMENPLDSWAFRNYLEDFGVTTTVRYLNERFDPDETYFKNFDFVILYCDPTFSELLPTVRHCSRMGKELPMFVILNGPGDQLHDAFFEGAECMFEEPHSAESLILAMYNSLNEFYNEQKKRKFARKKVARVRAVVETDQGAIEGYAQNISLGGVFIGTWDKLPAPSEKVTVRLSPDGSTESVICGEAVVRWVRTEIKDGRPKGFGVEFVEPKAVSLTPG